jgi:hypothetical protein
MIHSSQWSPSFGLSIVKPATIFSFPMRAIYTVLRTFLDFITPVKEGDPNM